MVEERSRFLLQSSLGQIVAAKSSKREMKILKMVRFPLLNYVYRMLVMRNASRMYAQVSYGWLYVEELGC